MSDEEMATRLPECYCTPGDELRVCKPCARRAIVYARAEGRAQGAAEEREACAKIAEDSYWCEEARCAHHETGHPEQEGHRIAAAIRGRK